MEWFGLNFEWIVVVILVIVVFCLYINISSTREEVDTLKDKVKAMHELAESEGKLIITLKSHIEKLQYEIVELKCQMNK